jgi:glycine/D-amino acid oxidase-like deaminating enzyme
MRDSYAVLTEAMPAAVRRQVGVPAATVRDSHDPPHRIRWTDDHRALVVGAEQAEAPARKRDGLLRHWTFELMYEFLKMYPAIAGLQPEYAWRLSAGVARDGLPYIGPHRNYPRHLFALGDTDSLTGAFLAARILTRARDGQPDTAGEAFGFTR